MPEQDVQYGKQPPKNADVEFGNTPEASGTNATAAGDSDPAVVGVVPVYAGGDAVPDDAIGGGHTADDAPEPASGDENTSDDSADASEAESDADNDNPGSA